MSNNKKTIMCKQNEMIIDLETKVNELKTKLLTMDKDRNQLRVKHKTLSEDNIAQSRAIEKAQDVIYKLQEENQSLTSDNDQLSTQLEEASELADEHHSMKDEITQLRGSLDHTSSLCKTKDLDLQALSQQVTSLQSELDTLKSQNATIPELTENLKQMEIMKERQELTIKELQSHMAMVKKQSRVFTESQHHATISVTKVNVPENKEGLLISSLREAVQQAQAREL